MSPKNRVMNVLHCLQCNELSAVAFICEILQSRDTDYATARSTLTGNAVQICKQLWNNKNSHVETLSWASAVMWEELCDEVSELSLSSDGRGPGKHPRKQQHHANDRNVALLMIKAVVVISIFLQSSNEKCNSLQGWMGFFMKSMCVPEKAIEVLAHAGLSISLSSIHNAVTSMSKEISSTIKKEVCTLHAAFVYDNFDIAFNTAQPSLENRSSFVSTTSATVVPLHSVNDSNCHVLWSSAALWACDPRNTSPSSFPLMNEMRSFLVLHKNNTYNWTSDPTKHSP
ncbi:hypothetical protein BDN67DRAFT_877161, partial [Paxillus ammoniavirescens]